MDFAGYWAWLGKVIPGNDDVIKDIIKGLLVAAALGGIYFAGRKFRQLIRWLKERFRSDDCKDCKDRLQRARDAIGSQEGIWLTKPGAPPPDYALSVKASIPVVIMANLKGGVGKTTITANVAGMLAEAGERILLIDLDFQGSLSSMMLGSDAKKSRPGPNELSPASACIVGDKDANWLLANARPSPIHPRIFTLPSFYDLARVENQLLVRWLIKDSPVDMPFFLAKLLHSKEVRQAYDRVIIDAPPRLSAASSR